MIVARYLIGMALAVACAGPACAGILDSHDRQCISLRSIRTQTAETNASLIFHTNDGRAYRNALPAPCAGLLSVNELGTLDLQGRNGRLCVGDAVRLRQGGLRTALGVDAGAGAAACKLGAFEPISEMSLTEFLRR